ncbi:MAG TPA: aldo/keto reductase [Anaerolineaceae bacterium]|nr:aldo/keto reductase [Anaerolineaceae bacterium]HPN51667.1 aldo/keto reductase [Anaerolineaceae bacterium]
MPDSDLFSTTQMGLGTWAWGDRLFWGYGRGYNHDELEQAFQEAIDQNIRFFDTAEVYGQGQSELIISDFLSNCPSPVLLASKFMPYPWRFTKTSLIRALRGSLRRLKIPRLDLYQMHFPNSLLTIDVWMDAMTEAVDLDLVRYIGVSNYDRKQTELAQNRLIKNGKRLCSNQVEYNLLNRRIEKNGVFQFCKENDIHILAFSPLAMGVLTGKYTEKNPPPGLRGQRYSARLLKQISPLIDLMKRIGASHDGKTPSQVALNWIICKGAIPIPGAKNAAQVQQNAMALGWRLTGDEIVELDEISNQVTN